MGSDIIELDPYTGSQLGGDGHEPAVGLCWTPRDEDTAHEFGFSFAAIGRDGRQSHPESALYTRRRIIPSSFCARTSHTVFSEVFATLLSSPLCVVWTDSGTSESDAQASGPWENRQRGVAWAASFD
jgi:hypothetical protein